MFVLNHLDRLARCRLRRGVQRRHQGPGYVFEPAGLG